MKLQSLTIIFVIIILPIILLLSSYIGYEIDIINKQNAYNSGVMKATHDAIFAFELNTKNDSYSNNAESKRSNIKAAVKTFENSLSTTCNLGLYNNEAIEEYIPAIVFGLYDGFYMYAPSELTTTKDDGTTETTHKHNLRNYVYYSEQIDGTDIVIRYSLDNYVVVSGTFFGSYQTKSGYLLELDACNNKYTYDPSNITCTLSTDFKYNDVAILQIEDLKYQELNSDGTINENGGETANTSAKEYFESAIAFTEWFVNTDKYSNICSKVPGLKVGRDTDKTNDPEKENSKFVQHKREIMQNKIEEVLNSSITAYSKRAGNINYKMPKFSAEEWEKIYSNISVISLVQGMDLGFKNYNGYCILNSTNSQEYVNSNLMYFVDDAGNYHDIRCSTAASATNLTGYRIGDFETTKYEKTNGITGEIETAYYYKHNEYACYGCINGNSSLNIKSVQDYISSSTSDTVKIAYYTSLARERNKTTKLQHDVYNAPSVSPGIPHYTVQFHRNEPKRGDSIIYTNTVLHGEKISKPVDPTTTDIPDHGTRYEFDCWYIDEDGDGNGDSEYEFDEITSLSILPVTEDINLYAQWKAVYTVTFHFPKEFGSIDGAPEEIDVYLNENVSDYLDKNEYKTLKDRIDNYTKYEETAPRYPDRFEYWCSDASYTTKYELSNPIRKNINLYPLFTEVYTITFYDEDKTTKLVQPSRQLVNHGNKATKPDDPYKDENHKFVKWRNKKDNADYDFNTPVTEDVNLYAVWKKVYTVQFDTQEGTPVPPNQIIDEGGTVTRPADPVKTGYNFEGWYLGSNLYNFSQPVTSGFTLVAHWKEKEYLVKFETYGGTPKPANQTVKYGHTITKPATDPEKSGKGFKGWYKDSGYTEEFDFNTDTIKGNTTIYAKWGDTFSITFYRNDGTTNIEKRYTEIGKYGSDNLKRTAPTPSAREHYRFEGWNTKQDGSGTNYNTGDYITVDTNNDGIGDGDVSLYAQWTLIEITVKFTVTETGFLGTHKKAKLDFDIEIYELSYVRKYGLGSGTTTISRADANTKQIILTNSNKNNEEDNPKSELAWWSTTIKSMTCRCSHNGLLYSVSNIELKDGGTATLKLVE